MKIPRDASRPKLEDLVSLVDEIATLPFQPEEEDLLRQIIDNAQGFRDHIARFCNNIISTEAEVETQRFYLRKIEGAEVLLAYETNYFRQELHKWCPVAPEAPPILEVSLSTRKPRPTKLQKMLQEYGVENPDDLPDHAKGKANSLRRKAANAEAAAAAAQTSGSPIGPPSSHGGFPGQPFFPRQAQSNGSSAMSPSSYSHVARGSSASEDGRTKADSVDPENGVHPGLLGAGGPQVHVGDATLSLEERLLQGKFDDIELHTEDGKSKALEILGRTEKGRSQAETIWGTNVWESKSVSIGGQDRPPTPMDVDPMMKQDESSVDQMFKEMTNQDDDDDRKVQVKEEKLTVEGLESERYGLQALSDED
jgi:histone demethylase JARID1